MPDITKCYGLSCPIKETCCRYTSKPNEYRQAYFIEIPHEHREKEVNKNCDYYIAENK